MEFKWFALLWVIGIVAFEIGVAYLWNKASKAKSKKDYKPRQSWFGVQSRYFRALRYDTGNKEEESFIKRFNFLLLFHLPLILIGLVAVVLWGLGFISWAFGLGICFGAAFVSFCRVLVVKRPQEETIDKLFQVANSEFHYSRDDQMRPWAKIRIKTWIGVTPGEADIVIPPSFNSAKPEQRLQFERHYSEVASDPEVTSYVYDWDGHRGVVHVKPVPPLPKMIHLEDVESKFAQMPVYQIPLGQLKDGGIAIWDLSQHPHAFVVGTTGAGKSGLQVNVLYHVLQRHPDKFIMYGIDQKRVELTMYEGFPNMMEVATTPDETYELIKNVHEIMMQRFEMLQAQGVNNLDKLDPGAEKYPYLMVLLDECAQALDIGAGQTVTAEAKEIKELKAASGHLIGQIAQLGRAARVHMLIATQRGTVAALGPAGGTLRENLSLRCILGQATTQASMMALDSNSATYTPPFKGRGIIAYGVGCENEFQAYWLDGEEWANNSDLNEKVSTGRQVITDDYSVLSGDFSMDEDLPETTPQFDWDEQGKAMLENVEGQDNVDALLAQIPQIEEDDEDQVQISVLDSKPKPPTF